MELVIMTTAITRGDFHKRSLGKFYELYNPIFIKDKINVHHIINVDYPVKLQNTFKKEDTVDLLKDIIPDNVRLTLIDNTEASFLTAYKNLVNTVSALKLSNNTLVWWLEDDWEVYNFNPDLFNIVSLFGYSRPMAFNSVKGSPLASFRGGPIMNLQYFNRYFNVERHKVCNNSGDPEKQVNRWVSGLDIKMGREVKRRDISVDNVINVVYFYMGAIRPQVNDIAFGHYANPAKFNRDIKIRYYVVQSHDLKRFNVSEVRIDVKKINFNAVDLEGLLDILDNDGITYTCMQPWILRDIGRAFHTEHSLKKWAKRSDGNTYS